MFCPPLHPWKVIPGYLEALLECDMTMAAPRDVVDILIRAPLCLPRVNHNHTGLFLFEGQRVRPIGLLGRN